MNSSQNPLQIKLTLTIECLDLHKVFFQQTIEPYLVISTNSIKGQNETVFTSQTQKNNHNPIFTTNISLNYRPSQNQTFYFQIFHLDYKSKLVGSLQTTIGQILTAPSKQLRRPLYSHTKVGSSIIIKHFLQKSQFVKLKFESQQLQYKNIKQWLFPTKLSFKLIRIHQENTHLLHQSQILESSSNKYQWKQFIIQKKSKIDHQSTENTQLHLQLYDGTKNDKRLIGSHQLSFQDLHPNKLIFIANNKQQNHTKILILKSEPKYSFYQLIEAGLQLNLMIGIDFSGSNKSHQDPKSLHYNKLQKSPYYKALQAVSQSILGFTAHKKTPLYGFGTKVKHPNIYTGNQVQQCFPLTGQLNNAQVEGPQNITQTYLSTLPYLQFSGPTKYSQVINKAMQYCRKRTSIKPAFTVLAILTDGQVSDMQQVKQLLIKAASLPLAIIFVGIGQGSFQDIIELTNAKGLEKTKHTQILSKIKYVNFMKLNNDRDDLTLYITQQVSNIVQNQMQSRKQSPELIQIGSISNTPKKKPSQTSNSTNDS